LFYLFPLYPEEDPMPEPPPTVRTRHCKTIAHILYNVHLRPIDWNAKSTFINEERLIGNNK
jgi:hypothetical protein